MLAAYQAQFTALIQAPSSPTPLISAADQTTYINTARNQVAGEGECIRVPATLALTNNTQSYAFSTISVSAVTGASAALTVRLALIGGVVVDVRSWEWFSNYYLGSATTGTPVRMAQRGQGANGTLYFSPIPNGSFTVNLDVIATPIPLVNDATAEAIPYPWTDAVPYYAAWLGMMSLQRQRDADQMFARYEELMLRARRMSTPTVMPSNLPGDMGARGAASKTTLTGAGTSAPPAQAGA